MPCHRGLQEFQSCASACGIRAVEVIPAQSFGPGLQLDVIRLAESTKCRFCSTRPQLPAGGPDTAGAAAVAVEKARKLRICRLTQPGQTPKQKKAPAKAQSGAQKKAPAKAQSGAQKKAPAKAQSGAQKKSTSKSTIRSTKKSTSKTGAQKKHQQKHNQEHKKSTSKSTIRSTKKSTSK